MHWHTIEFSNNTSTPKPTHKHVGKSKVTKVFSSAIVFLPATQTREPYLLSSGALSVSLTGIKLHTPKHKHKPAAHKGFLSVFKYPFWVHFPAEIRRKEPNANQEQDPC